VFVRRRPETEPVIQRFQVDCGQAPIPAADPHPPSRAYAFNQAANAAGVLHALGRDSEALLLIDRALKIFSESGHTHRERARILASLERGPEAEQEFGLAVGLDPSQEAWSEMADFYAQQQRFAPAIDAYQHAAALARYPHDLLVRVGYLYLETNQAQPALRAFEQSQQAGPYRALTAERRQEFEGAVAAGRARAYFQLGDVNRAAIFQREAVGFTPNDADRWVNLANLYRLQGRTLDAQEAASRAEALRQR